ncbi:MAG: argininosuccinate lyase [Candidatus Omnitrophica bacterium]|nr:argininosuccinate lyase [Candidatus Omnitrophota bacterium]
MKKLWGGRFKKGMHPVLKCFSYSLYVDYQLLESELEIDIAWAKMLGRTGLLTKSESAKLVRSLASLMRELIPSDPHDKLPKAWLQDYEDVHTLIQSRLEKKAGSLGKKIHTGRSRNDLVVASTRLWARKKLSEIQKKILVFQKSLLSAAARSRDLKIAGMTHFRKAQPVLLAHHFLAYLEMIEEDRARLAAAMARLDLLVLGSAALAGTSLPIDQKFLARELGYSKIVTNSMAAVSDRAFMTEIVSGLAILWMHLSRLAEDFILWNSEYLGFIEIDDAFATGSSLMPHKKNPDVFELIRGRASVIFGHLQTLLVLQKGLPLTYQRDLQEDKPAFFDSVNKTGLALDVLSLTLNGVTFNAEALKRSVEEDALYATDLLEYLVEKKIPFSEAHEAVGRAMRFAIDHRRPLESLGLHEFRRFSKAFGADVYNLFNETVSVTAKRTKGSTHPERVRAQIKQWRIRLDAH